MSSSDTASREVLISVTDRLQHALAVHNASLLAIAHSKEILNLQHQSFEATQKVLTEYGGPLDQLYARRHQRPPSHATTSHSDLGLNTSIAATTTACVSLLDCLDTSLSTMHERLQGHTVRLSALSSKAQRTSEVVRASVAWMTPCLQNTKLNGAPDETDLMGDQEQPLQSMLASSSSPLSQHVRSLFLVYLQSERDKERSAEQVVRTGQMFQTEKDELDASFGSALVAFAETNMSMYRRQTLRLREELKLRAAKLRLV